MDNQYPDLDESSFESLEREDHNLESFDLTLLRNELAEQKKLISELKLEQARLKDEQAKLASALKLEQEQRQAEQQRLADIQGNCEINSDNMNDLIKSMIINHSVYSNIKTLINSGFKSSSDYFPNLFVLHFNDVVANIPPSVKSGTKESYKDHIAKNVKIKAFEFFKSQNKSATISELIDAAEHAKWLVEEMDDDFISYLRTGGAEGSIPNLYLYGEPSSLEFE